MPSTPTLARVVSLPLTENRLPLFVADLAADTHVALRWLVAPVFSNRHIGRVLYLSRGEETNAIKAGLTHRCIEVQSEGGRVIRDIYCTLTPTHPSRTVVRKI